MLKKAAVAVVIVLAVVVGTLVVFGVLYIWWPSFRQDVWQPFKDNAEPWVAIGTILLAAATTLLALLTRSEIKASLEEVAVSRQALQTNTRPLLVDAPLRTHMVPKEQYRVSTGGSPAPPAMEDRAKVEVTGGNYGDDREQFGYFSCSVPLQNVGTGLALIKYGELRWPEQATWKRSISQTGVRPGDLTRFDFTVDGLDPTEGDLMVYRIEKVGRFELSVYYTDINGGQLTESRVAVEGTGADEAGPRRARWRVVTVELYDPPGFGEPFATLRREIVEIGAAQEDTVY
jgi:hypothetical protein